MDTKKITKLPVLETLPEGAHILVEDGTGAKRVPKAAMTVETDATLTKEGAAADAKATGNAIGEVKGKIGSLLMFTEIVPETVLNFDGMTMMENPFHLPLAKDEKYTVIYDEDEYEVTAFLPDPEAANQIAIGNYAIDGMPGEDTSEPFFIVYDPDVAATMMIVAEAGEHVISVYGNKLSPAFMPYIPNTASIPRGYAVQSGSTGFHFNTDLGASGAEIKQAIIDGGTACIEFSYGVLWYAGTVNFGMEMYLFTGVGYDKKTDETMLPIVMQAIVNADDPETLLISRQEVAMAKNSIIPEAYIPDTIPRVLVLKDSDYDTVISGGSAAEPSPIPGEANMTFDEAFESLSNGGLLCMYRYFSTNPSFYFPMLIPGAACFADDPEMGKMIQFSFSAKFMNFSFDFSFQWTKDGFATLS